MTSKSDQTSYWLRIDYQCPHCNRAISADAEVPDPESFEADSKEDDGINLEIISKCAKCEKEYIVNLNMNKHICKANLVDYESVVIHLAQPRYMVDFGDEIVMCSDEYIDSEYPCNFYDFIDFSKVFHNNVDECVQLLRERGDENDTNHVNRMGLIQIVTAFEAYLLDTLLYFVRKDSNVIRNLANKDGKLQEFKYTLRQIIDDSDLVTKEIIKYLRDIRFHNLKQVDSLYEIAFGYKILSNTNRSKFLLKAIRLRHDCVHRNGYDVNGRRITAINRFYVENISNAMKEIVFEIEAFLESEFKFYHKLKKNRRDEIPF